MNIFYEWPPTRSDRAKWALEELEIEYRSEEINLYKGDQRAPSHLEIHPLGAVPALRTDYYQMFESTAIVLQLIDENPKKNLAPEPGSYTRAEYYQWCVFAAAELDPPLLDYFNHKLRPADNLRPPQLRQDPSVAQLARQQFEVRAKVLSDHLGKREFLLGDTFTGADICVGHSLRMAQMLELLGDFPVLKEYLERLSRREAYRRVYKP
ncbi:MAG: glutathione S-transferase family protein [Candidatus Omnitrophica bacterium]|nr:glutathione S-transferase family protein [Candidatus Omnitrophota bacterium]